MTNSDTLHARRQEAENILNEINELSLKAEGIYESIQKISLQSSVEKKTIDKNNKVLIDVIKGSNQLIENYRNERDRIKVVTRQIDKFYNNSFTPLMNKINDSATGFKSKIKQNDQILTEVIRIKDNANSHLVRLKAFVEDYKQKINALRSIEQAIIKIDRDVQSKKENISKVNEFANEIKDNITIKQKSVIESEKEVSKLEEQIKRDSDSANTILSNIIDYEKEANFTLEKIRDIYRIASNAGLAGAFNERRKEYATEILKWHKIVGWMTGLLVILIIGLYVVHLVIYWGDEIPYDANFYIRFFLTSPLVFYLVFSTNQYNKAKKNHERYSLRTTVALSIESHLELLANNPQYTEEESIKKILDFILTTFNNLYKESHSDETKIGKEELKKDYLDSKFEKILELLKEVCKIKST